MKWNILWVAAAVDFKRRLKASAYKTHNNSNKHIISLYFTSAYTGHQPPLRSLHTPKLNNLLAILFAVVVHLYAPSLLLLLLCSRLFEFSLCLICCGGGGAAAVAVGSLLLVDHLSASLITLKLDALCIFRLKWKLVPHSVSGLPRPSAW